MKIFLDAGVLFAPGKAANAGGVAVSAWRCRRSSMRLPWPSEEVDNRLQLIMKEIHKTCAQSAESSGHRATT